MGNDVKFADMRVGDNVEFLDSPARSAISGVIALLNPTMVTFEATSGIKVSVRRASLVLDKRTRIGDGHSTWRFE